MQKSTIVVLVALLATCTVSITDNEKLNQVFYGIFSQNKLQKPQYCILCIDQVTAKLVVNFANKLLPELARLLPPIQKVKKDVTDFANSLDHAVLACLGYSYEIQFLGEKFGIEAGSSAQDVEKEFEQYYIKHQVKVHNTFVELNKMNNQGKYFEAGVLGSTFLHQVVDGKNGIKEGIRRVGQRITRRIRKGK